MKKGLEQVPDEYKKIAEKLMTAFSPTLKAGNVDFAAGLIGPNSQGMYTFIIGGKVEKGLLIEKSIKEAVKLLPDQFQEYVGFDAEEVAGTKIHAVKIKDFLLPRRRKCLAIMTSGLLFATI